MSIPSIALAQHILSTDSEKVEYSGNTGSHWSFKLLVAGALISAITAVAQAIFNYTAWMVLSIAVTITQGIGAYFVHQLSLLKEYDFYLKKLTEKVQEIAKELGILNTENSKLKQEADQFKSAIQENKKIIEDAKQESIKEKARFDEVNKELTQTAAKLEGMKVYIDSLEKSAALSQSNIAFRQAENARMQTLIDAQQKNLDKAASDNTQLKQNIESLEKTVKDLQADNQSMVNANIQLSSQLSTLKQMLADTDKIKKQFDQLSANTQNIIKDTKDVKDVTGRLEALKADFIKAQQDLQKLEALSQLIPLLEKSQKQQELQKKINFIKK